MLEEMKASKAMQLAGRFINARAFRRRRRLLETCTRLVQAHWRATVASKYGLCTKRAAFLFIIVFRDLHEQILRKREAAEVNAFYTHMQQVWRKRDAEELQKKRQEEADELSRQIKE